MSTEDLYLGQIVTEEVNWFRQANGRWGLEVHDDLSKGAEGHNNDMRALHYFGHSSPGYNDGFVENVCRGLNGDSRSLIRNLIHDWSHRDRFLLENLCGQGVAVMSCDCRAGLYIVFTWRGRFKG